MVDVGVGRDLLARQRAGGGLLSACGLLAHPCRRSPPFRWLATWEKERKKKVREQNSRWIAACWFSHGGSTMGQRRDIAPHTGHVPLSQRDARVEEARPCRRTPSRICPSHNMAPPEQDNVEDHEEQFSDSEVCPGSGWPT